MNGKMQNAIVDDLSLALRKLAETERTMPAGKDETGRMLRLAKTIQTLGGLPNEITVQLAYCRNFADYMMMHVTEQQRLIIAPIIAGWLDEMKSAAQEGRPLPTPSG